MKEKIYETIVSVIPEIKDETIHEDDDYISRYGVDSLALVDLVVNLEEAFNVSIPFDELDIDNFRSINSIHDLVNRVSE